MPDHHLGRCCFGIVFAPSGGSAYGTLEATGPLLRLNIGTGAQAGAWSTGANPRHLSITGDLARLPVSRFITPPLPGEGTAAVSTPDAAGGEVLVYTSSNMVMAATIGLTQSERAISSCVNLATLAEVPAVRLRNTISLVGRAELGQGRLHSSGNFDEVQDFEAQIRNFAGGTGLMTDTPFNTGTRNQPLGDAKAGVSLHDGSAATLAAFVTAHRGVSLGSTDLSHLVAYLAQIGSEEVVRPRTRTAAYRPVRAPPRTAAPTGAFTAGPG